MYLNGQFFEALDSFWHLLEEAQRCDSWEYFPLELFSDYHSILLFQVAIGSSPIFSTQSVESEKTWVLALVI